MANPGTSITYGGNSLQTDNILSDTIDHAGLPTIDAKQYPLSHANQSKIPYIAYPNRVINISGTIVGSSIEDCDNQIDTFKSYLVGNSQALVIGYGGSTRNYTATVTKATATRPYGLTYAKFQIEFTCDQPFGYAPSSSTAWSATGLTSGSENHTYTFGGTAPYQYPISTITLTDVSDSGGGYVTFGNNNTGQAITVSRTWADGDVLVIDATQNTVTVNGDPVAFTGAFPWFPPGSGTLYYVDNFSSRTFSVDVTYTEGYL